MNLCGKQLTEWEGKSIGLAFFLVVAIKSNLSTNAGAKVLKFGMRNVECGIFLFGKFLEGFLNAQIFFLQSFDDETFVNRPSH